MTASPRLRFENAVKKVVPTQRRRQIQFARVRARSITASRRKLPDFLVIGAERGGTSSLYKYLGRHPQIKPSIRKETEYFNRYYHRGEAWYRGHFPLDKGRIGSRSLESSYLTFEATPAYLFDYRVPARAAALLPTTKLIVLLRNPVARALSAWRHMRALELEHLPFEDAIAAEPARIGNELDRLASDPFYFSRAYTRYSYLARGRYVEQLTRWFEYFDRQSFMIITSESLFADPARALTEIHGFLGVGRRVHRDLTNYSSATSSRPAAAHNELPEHIRQALQEYFAPANVALEELLDRQLGWQTTGIPGG